MMAFEVTAKFRKSPKSKEVYVVTVSRKDTKSDIATEIKLGKKVVHEGRVDRSNAFGSGVCRSVLDEYLYQQKHNRPRMRFGGLPRLKSVGPKLFKS